MRPSILFFCASFTSGGVEKVLVNLANHFCKSEYPTSFLVCQNIGELNTHLNRNVKVYSFNKRLAKSFWSAVTFFRKQQSDVIICGPQFINILCVLILKGILRRKTKLIVTHHSFYDLDVKNMHFLHLFYKVFVKMFYKHADAVVAVSYAVKNHLVNDIGLPEGKIDVIYNPVIDENFSVLRDELISHKWMSNSRNFKVLVCVGRLSKVKNQIALVNIMPDLIKFINCKLIIIGSGAEEEVLKALVVKLNMEEYIDFIGNLANPVKFINASDLVIIPSITETFSLVAVESVAVGTPVLSTPTLGILEILGDCEGCFFEDIENQLGFIERARQILAARTNNVDQPFVEKFKVHAIGSMYERLVRRVSNT